MILQKDPRLRKEIQEWGCYLMSIFWFVNKFTNLPVSPDIINGIYDKLLLAGYINEECEILNPQAIFEFLKMPVIYHDRHDPPDYKCQRNEFEILEWRYDGIRHFVAGNGQGVVTYDPMGCSRTVRYGKLHSKRIFKLLETIGC